MKTRSYPALCLLLALLLLSACSAPSSTGSLGRASRAPQASPSSVASAPGELNELDENKGFNGEVYLPIDENAQTPTSQNPLLTFSLKVDTASYTNAARYIQSGALPPPDAVRVEEMVNYFRYDGDMRFDNGSPFAVSAEVAPSPLNEGMHMAFIRVKTEEIETESLPSSNLVFLIDTSGSMNSHDKLPLLKEAFALLAETLDGDDTVSLVTYAGSSHVVLDGARGDEQAAMLDAMAGLSAGGSTAGAQGIKTAYELAEKHYRTGGNNRVILATDGDFNVGISSAEELETFIADKRESGVFLSVLGFGTGNIRDDIMETLSKHGNGNYSYINSVDAAQKVLVDERGGMLFTVAEDVKAQIEFNPENVRSYRLIGYENRVMSNEDFRDDAKDAGEVGAGTDVVMLFEMELGSGQALKYGEGSGGAYADELFEVRIRYKNPGASKALELTVPVAFGSVTASPGADFRFACSVAGFGLRLRGSEHGGLAAGDLLEMARGSLGADENGYRAQFLELLDAYGRLAG